MRDILELLVNEAAVINYSTVFHVHYFRNAITSYLNGTPQVYDNKISCWDVRAVTDMDNAFKNQGSFNDVLCWNVSGVTGMFRMFYYADTFNQDISFWGLESHRHRGGVTSMYGSFHATKTFNQDISSWDVSSVGHFENTFVNSTSFNQDISSWNVSSAYTMQSMFNLAIAFNQSLCDWSHKSPSLLNVLRLFTSAISCPCKTTPVLRGGTSDDPHQGPFCFACP
eukprot:scaffold17183_cov57-Attheya_sp.AAC.3